MSKSRILLAALITAGCGGGTNVVIDYDRQATFAGRETYTWVFLNEEDRALYGAPSQASQDRIVEAVESKLTAMGYRKVTPPTDADLLVGFAVAREDKVDIQQVYAVHVLNHGRHGIDDGLIPAFTDIGNAFDQLLHGQTSV